MFEAFLACAAHSESPTRFQWDSDLGLFHNPPFLLFEPFHGGFTNVLKIPLLLKLPFLV